MPPASAIRPELPPDSCRSTPPGLIALSGCPQGELAQLVVKARYAEARTLVRKYLDWFGADNYYIELQHNLAPGDTDAQQKAAGFGSGDGRKGRRHGQCPLPRARERHQLQDCLVAIKNCKSLEETHRERRANSEYYLRPPQELEALFKDCPEALNNTVEIAERCTLRFNERFKLHLSRITPRRKAYTPRATWKSCAWRPPYGATARSPGGARAAATRNSA